MNIKSMKKRIVSPAMLLLSVLGLLGLSVTANAASLQNMTYASLPGNKLEVRLTFDSAPPEVKGYSIEKPARIALDLMGVKSDLSNKYHNLGTGNAKNITVVEAKDRTRLIVNLIQLQSYETRTEGNDLVVVLGADPVQNQAATSSSDGVVTAEKEALRKVDFHRGPQGEGQVTIRLSKPSIPVDVREEGGKIIAKFVGAVLPQELHRRLDVTDFSTPVRFIDSKFDGKNSIVTIEPTGSWEYLAYQADNQFTINVKLVSEAEAAKRKKDSFQYTGEKLSLSFQDIEVRSVLQLVADFTGLNLVASDTVEGRITLRLQNVPWDQALDLILKTKGLDKRQIGNVLLVAPADEIAAREQLELESQKKIEALAPLRTEFIRVNYAKAADLLKLIKEEGSLLSSRGSITTDERTNTMILQDTQSKLDEIKDIVSLLDVQVQQVLIEARVVIATTDTSKQLGVRWGATAYSDDGKVGNGFIYSGRRRTVIDAPGAQLATGFDPDDASVDDSLLLDMGVNDAAASRFSIGFVDLDSGLIDLELSALDSEGYGELVATPKVLTADQQPAVIASGTQIGYEKSTSSGATSVEFIEAELRLEVTPHITPEGKVILDIKVNNDSLGEIVAGIPSIDTNRVETSVLVSDGETVVLGGIFQESTTKLTIKTPFLGDLPWIGNLFRKKIDDKSKQELLIFMTPRLVKDTVAGN